MLQQILTIRRTVLHLTDQTDQFGVQTVNTQVDCGALTHLDDLLLDLLLYLRNHLLDTCGVDTTVGNQLMQSQSSDLAAYGIEARQDDCLGRIINDDLDARCSLQGADVTTLATDDTTLHLVAIDVENSHRVLDCGLGCHALNRLNDNTFSLLIGAHLSLLDGLVDVGHRVSLSLSLHILDQRVLSLLAAHTADLLQACVLLAHHTLDILLLAVECNQLTFKLLFQTVRLVVLTFEILLLILDRVLILADSLLTLFEFSVTLIDLTVVVAFELNELLLCLEDLLFLYHFALSLSLFDGCVAACTDCILGNHVGDHDITTHCGYGRQSGDQYYDTCAHCYFFCVFGLSICFIVCYKIKNPHRDS